MSQLAGFVDICEGFLGIKPNKDLFRRMFEVKSRKVRSSDKELTLMGRLNIQMLSRLSSSYPSLPLKNLNQGWHANWFDLLDDAATPLPPSPSLLR